MLITKDIRYVGVNDHKVDLFEGQYVVPEGMAYNSYVILDEKIAVMDTVDRNFKHEWLAKLEVALGERKPDYLVVQHMEPDHSANIKNFMDIYPEAKIVSSAKAFVMMKNFFGTDFEDRQIVIKEGDTLELGKHVLNFVAAPMVHWPEVMVTYDSTDKVLFSADALTLSPTGLARQGVTISASSASTALRFRTCSKRLLHSISRSSVRSTAPSSPRTSATTSDCTTPGRPIR